MAALTDSLDSEHMTVNPESLGIVIANTSGGDVSEKFTVEVRTNRASIADMAL